MLHANRYGGFVFYKCKAMKELLEQVDFCMRDTERKVTLESIMLKHAQHLNFQGGDKEKLRQVAYHFTNDMVARIIDPPGAWILAKKDAIDAIDYHRDEVQQFKDEIERLNQENDTLLAEIQDMKNRFMGGTATPPASGPSQQSGSRMMQAPRTPEPVRGREPNTPTRRLNELTERMTQMQDMMAKNRDQVLQMSQALSGNVRLPVAGGDVDEVVAANLDDYERARGMDKKLRDLALKGTDVTPTHFVNSPYRTTCQ